jgi:predicted transcriptional regulator
MSQHTLAKKIGTTQSNIARMEAGNQNFSMATLTKLARAFRKTLEVNFI